MDLRILHLIYVNVNWFAEYRAQGLVMKETKFQTVKPNYF
jgi:hypothetical protein